jgi:hypothetical protein
MGGCSLVVLRAHQAGRGVRRAYVQGGYPPQSYHLEFCTSVNSSDRLMPSASAIR